MMTDLEFAQAVGRGVRNGLVVLLALLGLIYILQLPTRQSSEPIRWAAPHQPDWQKDQSSHVE